MAYDPWHAILERIDDAAALVSLDPDVHSLLRTPERILEVSVPVKMDSGVPTVEVTLNGKVTRTMTVDSGSSLVCIPADLAKDLALVPGPNDPEIIMQLADGKSHKARQMSLASVRVGTFTVENVDCAVLEADLISAEPLLGGTFLQNFIYKLDPKAGELHLARIGGDAKGTVNNVGKPKPEMPAGK